MPRPWIWLVCVWLFTAAPVCAQLLPIPPAPPNMVDDWPAPFGTTNAVFGPQEPVLPTSFSFWVRSEYLLGWVRGSPIPVPLATTGSSSNKVPGAIGQSGTVPLTGNANNGFRVLNGLRFTAGSWIDSANTFGIQVSGYVQEVGANHFDALSNNAGTPLLALPYKALSTKAASENAVLIANPKKLAGTIDITSHLSRWGEDAAGLWCFYREPNVAFTLVVGARHDDLLENLDLSAKIVSLTKSTTTLINDRFSTRNQFFGSEIGGSMFLQRGSFFLDTTFKLGLGETQQYVEIQGASSISGAKPASFAGGLFAQPSNSGHVSASTFTAMPILETKVGYQVTQRLRAFVGYDFLYWNGVVRPGNQIDRNINLSQDPILGATKGVQAGPIGPLPRFDRSGFWAQDINFGVDFRF